MTSGPWSPGTASVPLGGAGRAGRRRNIGTSLEPKLTTFGRPAPRCCRFRRRHHMTIESCFQVVNQFDVVPYLPLPFPLLPHEHVGVPIAVDSGGPIDQGYRHSLPRTAAAWTI